MSLQYVFSCWCPKECFSKVWHGKFGTFKELLVDENNLVEARFLLNVVTGFIQVLII